MTFPLESHVLLSGEPLFFLPVDGAGTPCHHSVAVELRAYTYNHLQSPTGIFPCSAEVWDAHALCLQQGKWAMAITALGMSASVAESRGWGYFSRYPGADRGLVGV